MPYGKFESVEQVARLFSVKVNDAFVAGSKAIELPTPLVQSIRAKLLDSLSFRNEATICNKVITPILNAVAEQNKPLNIWIEEPFNVDPEKGLVGEPDYLIAPATAYGGMALPPLCIIEAKKQDWDAGWAQALAEMVAASLQGADICYSAVTTGKIWQFGKMESSIFSKDPNQISATRELQLVFDTLNWVFSEVNR
ncbi:Type I restriction enzyme R protein N-terminal domain-containing protein [Candidatus Electrothrix gigas]